MTEIEQKNYELYKMKFEASPTLFTESLANDYMKLLKSLDMVEEACLVGETFLNEVPELKQYINQYGYVLYNTYINVEDEKIKADLDTFFEKVEKIISMCKPERFSPFNATLNKAIRVVTNSNPIDYSRLIELLGNYEVSDLSMEPFTNKEGKEFESQKERYYRLLVRALYETKQYEECITQANIAYSLNLKWHYNAQSWIAYYRALSLVETKDYVEAKHAFLSLQNRIRGVDFNDVLYTVFSENGDQKEANIYLLHAFFEKGYSIDHLEMYKKLLAAITKTEKEELISCVDEFISALTKEKNIAYTALKEYETTASSSDLYDIVYNKVMTNLSLLVERKEASVVYYNDKSKIGTIGSDYKEDGIFFRQADFVYDEDVQKRDKVEYTVLPTFDNKKQTISSKAILIVTTEEYVDFGF
ncbi:hypothetical protein [Tannockella kyphosi]|uniref:hypothetical protein n=1 Tax=Tannockella kyphosi TaxID=2899121 RepID=UPI00201293FB|nr:hypothetical protein [Tannockella kyphosi]